MVDHWCRRVLNDAVDNIVREAVGPDGSLLEISGDTWSGAGVPRYRSVHYPDFDICTDRLRERFDVVLAEQVFEHIRHPAWAAHNAYSMLKPGGRFVVSTPFLVRYHPMPMDLWRWSAQGLGFLLEDAGFVDVRADSWGNRECVIANLDDWADSEPQIQTLDNDPDFPIQVWAVGTRPGRRAALRRRVRGGRAG